MTTRIVFGAELAYAIHVRGLTLTDLARRAGVALATASGAAKGRPVNVRTALRIAHTLTVTPIVPELVEWIARPPLPGTGAEADRPDGPGA